MCASSTCEANAVANRIPPGRIAFAFGNRYIATSRGAPRSINSFLAATHRPLRARKLRALGSFRQSASASNNPAHAYRPASERARAGHHSMALILAIGGMANFFRKCKIRVLKCAHHRRMHADIQRLQTVWISRRVEHRAIASPSGHVASVSPTTAR